MRVTRRTFVRTVAASVGAGVGVPALAACGASTGSSGGTTAARKPVTLTFESYSGGGLAGGQISEFDNWTKALDRAHEKYPWITIEPTYIRGMNPGSYDRWTVAMSGGTAPSIMEFETKRMASFAEKGLLLDLTKYTAKSKLASKADFLAPDWEKTIYKGKQWILVAMSKPGVFFYNEEALKRVGVNGLTTAWGDPTWTWERFVDLARQLTTGAGPNATYGFGQSTWWVYLQPYVWSNGGDFLNKERTRGTMQDPATLEALRRVQDLALRGKAMPVAANHPESKPSFENGRVAIYHNNSGNWLGYGQVPDLKWNVAPIPTGKARTTARNPPNGWASWSGEAHPDDTWLVMEQLTTPESLRNIEGVPSRQRQAEEGDFAAAKVPGVGWKVFIDAKKHSQDEPSTQYFQDLDKTIRTMQDDFWSGALSVNELAAQMDRKIDAVQRGEGPQD